MGGIKEFLKHEASGGILLMIATVAALLCQNTFLSDFYNEFLNTKFTMSFGEYGLSKPLILWVNDGLMAVFFFLIGLELKREVLEGELKKSVANRAACHRRGRRPDSARGYLLFFYQARLLRAWRLGDTDGDGYRVCSGDFEPTRASRTD